MSFLFKLNSAIYILFFWLSLGFTMAQGDFPERPSPPKLVNDFASMLSASDAQLLERKLAIYSDSTSTQITVVTLKNIGDYDIGDYAVKLGDLWGVGIKGKNNGLIILVVAESRKVYIATGYGMEGTIPDITAKRIVDQIIVPHFKQGDFYGGLDEATNTIISLLSGEFEKEPGTASQKSAFYVFLGIIILIVIFSLFSKGGGNGNGNSRGFGGGFFPLGGLGSGGFSSGGGYSGGGGGFGGFGGGSFGGGGAGGSW